ncbi:hypothetical protein HPB50_023414 [Hyalomma asiaticum]|uniref:Uncharacterized protein n=1 Tax=Hyalomma asiaticum TaxID=266040 RepID=A0ACB7S2E0_HYAAI|nr:hypothetical protein HPB50_023414 [Hyalomma asiaticum]
MHNKTSTNSQVRFLPSFLFFKAGSSLPRFLQLHRSANSYLSARIEEVDPRGRSGSKKRKRIPGRRAEPDTQLARASSRDDLPANAAGRSGRPPGVHVVSVSS